MLINIKSSLDVACGNTTNLGYLKQTNIYPHSDRIFKTLNCYRHQIIVIKDVKLK